jgi:hypothetical protein
MHDGYGLMRRRLLNDRLVLAERSFLQAEGLQGRAWYKHLVSNPTPTIIQQRCRKSQFFRYFRRNFILLRIMRMLSNDFSALVDSCTRPQRTMRVSSRSSPGSQTPSLGQGTRARNNGRWRCSRRCGESPWQSRGLQVCSEVNLALMKNQF